MSFMETEKTNHAYEIQRENGVISYNTVLRTQCELNME